MQTILVVVEENDATHYVVRTAAERAASEGASLIVLNVMPKHVYESRQDGMRTSPELARDGFTYTADQAGTAARQVAHNAATVAVDGLDVPFTAVGLVGTPLSAVLAVAAEYDCETIMIPARKPTWFGLRGGFDRALAKRFDGLFVRVPRPHPDNLRTERSVPEL